MDRNAPMKEVRQCKTYDCTRVKLRVLRVYIESLTMSSQEPPKGPKQAGGGGS